jgi:ATP-dependent DNA helicase RecQ
MAVEANLKEALKENFGFDSFRGCQLEIISHIVQGNDALVIMPTGAGKSLCYQLPALVLGGVTLVVSPLVALMKDQVDSLQAMGISATTINSSVPPGEQRRRLTEICQGKWSMVYVAPERFSPHFIERIKTANIQLLAIDEAHCVSQWGHDFRPDYLKLGRVREALGRVTTIALTATATPKVQDDIALSLGITTAPRYVTGFDRENLHLEVLKSTNRLADKMDRLMSVMRSTEGATLIYCATRKNVERVTIALRDENFPAGMYHAGLTMEERNDVQEAFMSSQIDIVVATNAFGMGVDKSNIRCIIHWEFPGTVEAYYQEIGRAGRDGESARIVLLYRLIDEKVQRSFIESSYPSVQWINSVWMHLQYLSQNENSNTVWIGHDELSKALSSDINSRAVGSCIYSLDREGYIRRLSSTQSIGKLWLINERPERNPKGIRGKVYAWINERLKGYPNHSLDVNLGVMAEDLQVTREQLNAALYALNEKSIIRWEAPTRVGGIELLRSKEPLIIDEEKMRRRRDHEFKKLELMKSYANATCRRRYLIEYFGETAPFEKCGTCDRCIYGVPQPKILKPIQVKEVQKLLACLARMSEHASRKKTIRKGFGRDMVVKVASGSVEKKVKNWGFEKISTHGILKGRNQQQVHELLDELVNVGLLDMNLISQKWGKHTREITYQEYSLSTDGILFMRGQNTDMTLLFPLGYVFGALTQSPKSKSSVFKDQSGSKPDGLIQMLKKERHRIAIKYDVPAYTVASNRTLEELVSQRPTTRDDLKQIHGLGPRRISKYGRYFLDILQVWKD